MSIMIHTFNKCFKAHIKFDIHSDQTDRSISFYMSHMFGRIFPYIICDSVKKNQWSALIPRQEKYNIRY